MSERKKQESDIITKNDLITSEESVTQYNRRSNHKHRHHHKLDSEEDSEKRRRKKERQRDGGTDFGGESTPSSSRRNREIDDIQAHAHRSFSLSSPSSPLQRRKKSVHTPHSNGPIGTGISPSSTLTPLKYADPTTQPRRVSLGQSMLMSGTPLFPHPHSLLSSSVSQPSESRRRQILIGAMRLRQHPEHRSTSPTSPQPIIQSTTPLKPLTGNRRSNSFKLRTPSPTAFRSTGDIGGGTNSDGYGVFMLNGAISSGGGADAKKERRKNVKRLSVYDLKQSVLAEGMAAQQQNSPRFKNSKPQQLNISGTSSRRPSVMQQTTRGYGPSQILVPVVTGSGTGFPGAGTVGSPKAVPSSGDRRKRVQSETFNKTDLLRSFSESWILLLNKCEVYVNMKTLSLVTTFEIQVSKSIAEPWKIVKSFNQFYELDVGLRYDLASVPIPKLPNKSVFKLGWDENTSANKMKELGIYLDEISQIREITESQTFNSWVEIGSDIVRTMELKRPDIYGYLDFVLTHTRKVRKLVVLASPILFFYDSDISEFLDSQKQAIWLGNAKLKLLGGGSNVFAVQAQNGGLFVLEASEKDSKDWIKKLTDAINETTRSLKPKHVWKRAIPFGSARHDSSSTEDETPDSSANSGSMRSTSSICGEDSEEPDDVFDGESERASEVLKYDKDGALSSGIGETHRTKIFMEKFGPAKKDVDVSLGQAVEALKEAQKNPDRAKDAKFVRAAQRLIRRCEKIMRSTPKDLITTDLLGKSTISLQKFRKKYENVVSLKALYNLSQLSRIVEGQNELTHSGERRKRIFARTYSQSMLFSTPPKIVQEGEGELDLLNNSRNKHLPYCSHRHNFSAMSALSHSTVDLPTFMENIQSQPNFTDESSEDDEQADTTTMEVKIRRPSTTPPDDFIMDNEEEAPTKPKRKKKSKKKKKKKTPEESGEEEHDLNEEPKESMTSEVNHVINSDEEEEGDSEEACEDETSTKQDRSLIMCRICEEEYPRYLLQEHTEYCVYIESLVSGDLACDNRIELLVKSLDEQREIQESQYPNIDTSPYTKVAIIGRAVVRLQYGSEEAITRCFNLLSELHWYLDNGSYDLLLLAFGKKLIKVIEEKYSVMKEFLRVHTKGIASSSQSSTSVSASPTVGLLSSPSLSSVKRSRKKNNFWGLLMFMKSGKVESETIRAINSAYSSRIKIGDFKLIKKISSGAYGKVFLARKNKTNDLYAVKVLKKEDTLRKNMTDNVIAERKILSSLNNPFVVNLYYAFQNKKYLYLVMEYCPGGDVGTLLKNLGAFDLDMARIYAAETVLALESMHKLHFVHRDLKPDNLLISATGHVVLTDFGLSTWGVMMGGDPSKEQGNSQHKQQQQQQLQQQQQQQQEEQEHRIFGTPDYLAPEILLGTGHGPEVDWWALGAMVFEFITSVPPFNDDSPEKIFDNIINLRIPWPSEEDGFPPVARDFIEKLLVLDVEKRLGHNGADEIKGHPFFEGINWDTLIYESREDIFIPQIENPEDTSYFEDHGSVNNLEPGQQQVAVDSIEEIREMEAETAAMMSAEAASDGYDVQRKQKKYAKSMKDDPSDDNFSDFEYTNTELMKKKTLELAINVDDIFKDDDDYGNSAGLMKGIDNSNNDTVE